jgi:hypothetical protein
MYYSYVEIEYVATSFSPARTDLALKLLMYYAQAVDPTLLATLSAILAQQANGTRAVAVACHQLLDYVATHPNAGI